MIRKYAIWVVVATLVGLAGAWLAVSGNSASYTATAAVDVEPRIISGSVPVTPNLATEEKVVTSGVVLDAAAPRLGISPGHLSAHVSVSVSGTSTILSIGCTMPEPDQAQNCATVVTDAYISFRNETGATKSAQARDPLAVTLVSPAIMPVTPAGTKKSVVLSIGAFLGLLLGLGAGYVRDRVDDRVRDRTDLGRHLGAPTLGEIGRVRKKAGPAAFASMRVPASAAAESYRYLRVRLDALAAADPSGGRRIIQVTGPRGGEGSTSVASNLATALAQVGHRVIMVDGDVRQATLSSLYGAAQRPGLTDLLAGAASLSQVIATTELPRLLLVPAGSSRRDPADLFESAALAAAFASLTAAADVVIVDSGPILAVSDPIALTAVSTVVLVVADDRSTTRTDVRAASHEISLSGGRHVVGVLNHRPRMLSRIFQPSPRVRVRSGVGDQGSSKTGGVTLTPQRRPDDKTVGISRATAKAEDQ
jgi:receptor protein-tyrosine kinase